MSRRGARLLLAALVGLDALAVGLALLAAANLTGRWHPAAVWAPLAWLVSFAALRLYDLDTVLEDSQEYATVATGCTYGAAVFTTAAALTGGLNISLTWLFSAWLVSVLAVGLGRFWLRRLVRALRRRGHLMAAALVVGADEQGRAIARQLRSEADSGLHVVGFVDDFLPPGTLVEDGLRILGHPGALPALVAEYHIAEVVVVPGAMAWESFQEILEHMAVGGGPRLRLSPGYYDLLASTPRVAHRNFVPLIVVDSARLSGLDSLLKAGLDFGLGSLLALASLPLGFLIAARLGRGGAAFIEQVYIGGGGRSFRARLFRAAPGSWLARTGLERLPLLEAVVRGRMSLVGPRPVLQAARAAHRRWLPSLASVKPGLTGPWAVVPLSGLEEEMRAALYYIRNWTIWLDLQILAQSILVTARGKWGGF